MSILFLEKRTFYGREYMGHLCFVVYFVLG